MAEDRVSCFICPARCDVELPVPEEWYRTLAGDFGGIAIEYLTPPLTASDPSRYVHFNARWAARAAMRACPELRP
jgi:hypothetical protein